MLDVFENFINKSSVLSQDESDAVRELFVDTFVVNTIFLYLILVYLLCYKFTKKTQITKKQHDQKKIVIN